MAPRTTACKSKPAEPPAMAAKEEGRSSHSGCNGEGGNSVGDDGGWCGLVVGGWWLVVGALPVGGWWLVVDGWWLVVGGWW